MVEAWDTVVVGAGMTGVLVAERLQAAGLRVLLLDGGPRLAAGQKTPEPDRRLWGFKAVGGSYDWYRVRAVGGRALLWGGWCYRFEDAALRRAGWPFGARTLAPAYAAVEKRLGVVDGMVDERYALAARELGVRVLPKRGAFITHDTAWTPVSSPAARRARTFEVALRLEQDGGRATGVITFDLRTEKTRHVRARSVVLAASPIETTRILLQSDVDARRWGIGRNLVDHMVASYVLLEPVPPPGPVGRGPFPGSALVENFVNLGEDTRRPYPGGFSLELAGPTRLEVLGLERIVAGDETERWSATLVHAMGEVFPSRKRFVDLDPANPDVIGRPTPRVHVGWTGADRRMARDLKQACVQVADALAVPGSRMIPFVDPLLTGAGHEAGTCAMGVDDRAACDPHGRLRALDNVWIADASAMPTAGDRHPTLTLLAHAHRVAGAVGRWHARRVVVAQRLCPPNCSANMSAPPGLEPADETDERA